MACPGGAGLPKPSKTGCPARNLKIGGPGVGKHDRPVHYQFHDCKFHDRPLHDRPFHDHPFHDRPFHYRPFYYRPFYNRRTPDDRPFDESFQWKYSLKFFCSYRNSLAINGGIGEC